MRSLLIIGIDPGTTVGYAVLDINGNLVLLDSQKHLGLSSLISIIIQHGKPIIVGCDVTPAPSFVEKFAAKTGCKLFDPEKDLLIIEKKELTKRFKKDITNMHQNDALSAALFAFEIVKPLFNKIDNLLKKQNNIDLSDQVKELVIKKDIPIKTAVDIIKKTETQTKSDTSHNEVRIIKKVIEKKTLIEKDFLDVYKRLKVYEKEIKILKHQNNRLKQELDKSNKGLRFILKRFSFVEKKERKQKEFAIKEKNINTLRTELGENNKKLEDLKKELFEKNQFISSLNNNYLLKKLDNLGSKEFEQKNKLLNITKDNILLVDDLDISSQNIISLLKDKIDTIIFRKASKKTLDSLPFTTIDAKNLDITEKDLFAFVNKDQLEKEKSKQDILTKVVKEYRRER